MLYWYTGQPGHGKTLHGLEFAMELKGQADKKHRENPDKYPHRELFVLNVRDADHARIGSTPLTPEEFKGWADSPEYVTARDAILMAGFGKEVEKKQLEELERQLFATEMIDPRFHNAIILIDEAYEHGIFPRRSPTAKVPRHVERVAKHRHYGVDLICICQSPDTQCDTFVRDLIEQHVHVRRRFGTKWVHCRVFDKFEANAEKATPITIKRRRLPKKAMGLYKSTQLDTTERRIPWYFFALAIGVPGALGLMYWTFGNMGEHLGSPMPEAKAASVPAAHTERSEGGVARVAPGDAMGYLAQFVPRVPSQPWSAPAYDHLELSSEPPRVFCMLSGDGIDAQGEFKRAGCSCKTEQATDYRMPIEYCRTIALRGQYEPYYDEVGSHQVDGNSQQQIIDERARRISAGAGFNPAAMPAEAGAPVRAGSQGATPVAAYGGFGAGPN